MDRKQFIFYILLLLAALLVGCTIIKVNQSENVEINSGHDTKADVSNKKEKKVNLKKSKNGKGNASPK